ncbi:MAG: hypothetical protein U0401_13820 [Anaerolineae bacterium]
MKNQALDSGHPALGTELISITVNATGQTVKPKMAGLPPAGPDPSPARRTTRSAFFTYPHKGWRTAEVYNYEALRPGNLITGPAIVESPVTTVVIPSEVEAVVDSFGNLQVNLSGIARLVKSGQSSVVSSQ